MGNLLVSKYISVQELSLLYGIRRSATLKCESNVDVLYVDEEVTKLLFPDKLQVNMDAKLLSLK